MAKGNVLKEKNKTSKTATSTKRVGNRRFSSLLTQVDSRKTKSITGATFILFSIYFFIAFISYIFTWKTDQNLLLKKGFFEFMFSPPELPIANWLGKFGAWSAHTFIYKGFGIVSFVICFIFFVAGVRLLLNIKLVSIKRSLLVGSVVLVWGAMFFGFFSNSVTFLGGTFGHFINEWLVATLGAFGGFLFILVALFVAVVALFNPDFKTLIETYLPKLSFAKSEKEAVSEDRSNLFNEHAIHDKDDDVLTASLDEELEEELEEDEDLDEEDLNFTVKSEEESEPEETEEPVADSEIEFDSTTAFTEDEETEEEVAETNTLTTKDTSKSTSDGEGDEEFSVEVAPEEKELSEKDLNKHLEEFGAYDPKLDLSNYTLPTIDLLQKFESSRGGVDKDELESNKNKIVETLSNYKIEISKIKATIGPTVTLYEIIPAPGVRISKIKNLEDDIALSLAALGIRIIAPIPGKGTIGIEVPNSKPEMVSMRSLIASEKFNTFDAELPVVMGKTITNETFIFDLAKMPHLLVAGATGQGKSVGLNAILVSILYKKHPSQVKFVLIDPKKVELTLYNKIERHFLAKLPGEDEAIITDTSKVVNTLNSLCIEMDNRYELLKEAQVRNIKEYNTKFIARKLNPEKGHNYMPYIVVLIDEFADLIMTAGKEVEHPIARLAQLARAIGIHLIVATQRPSVNVITGMIKANFPARIAFRVLSKIDSRTILDNSGADQLIGKGDMLITTGNDMIRLQCGFVDTPEVEDICDFIGNQRGYSEAFQLPEYSGEDGGSDMSTDDLDELDSNFVEAARIVVIHQQGSASLLQRKLKLGYNRAGRIVDQLEAHGIIGPFKGSKAREVLYGDESSLEEYLNSKGLL